MWSVCVLVVYEDYFASPFALQVASAEVKSELKRGNFSRVIIIVDILDQGLVVGGDFGGEPFSFTHKNLKFRYKMETLVLC